MDLAYKRYVEKLLDLVPIVFSYEALPEIYQHINFLDKSINPEFMQNVQEAIIEI